MYLAVKKVIAVENYHLKIYFDNGKIRFLIVDFFEYWSFHEIARRTIFSKSVRGI